MLDPFETMHEDVFLDNVYTEMLKVAFRFFRSKADALDIVQESWVKILVKLPTLQDKQKFAQWAKAIVRNTALNELRRRGFRQQWERHWLPIYFTFQSEDNPESELLWLDMLQQVSDMDTRRILIYKYKYDWKDQQIADRLGCPAGTVKAKLHRYRSRARKQLVENARM